MRKLLVIMSAVVVPFSAPISAQNVVPPPKPRVVQPAPAKKPFYKRIFGGKEAPPAPEPVVAPTPPPAPVAKSTPKPKPRSKPRTAESRTTSKKKKIASSDRKAEKEQTTAEKKEEKSEATAAEETKDAARPAGEAEKANAATAKTEPANEETGKGSAKKKGASAAKSSDKKSDPPKPSTDGMDDAEKFKTVKASALEDPAIKELKEKADGAIIESEAHAASVAYNRALFRKVREIEPSLDGYVDKLEGAMMKRLSGEKNGD